jgi:anti-anti-sigma factor
MQLLVDRAGGVLALAGDLDARTVSLVRDALHELFGCVGGDVVVDVTGVRMVDASGLGLLVAAHRRALTAGRRVVLRGVGPRLARLLAVTRLHRVLNVERARADQKANAGGS